ncbi:MAG: hypothetical protein GJ677_08700 [Rhodobacteraceae bacterium]|nr:hypothetical protein [Paracoccaceae bacterium]
MVAASIAQNLEVIDGAIVPVQPAYSEEKSLAANLSTTVDALATVFDMTAEEFVRRLDFELVKSDFAYIIVHTGNVEVRTAVAERMIAAGHDGPHELFRDLPLPVWEQGLRNSFKSPYIFGVNKFLGAEIGTLDASMMQELGAYQTLEQSVVCEMETGALPVNKNHDELRVLGLALDKRAAERVLKAVIALGMAENNPRLTMLKYNLQL